MGIASRLYRGETSFNFVGKRKIWFALSTFIIVISIFSLVFRGLNFGIEFKGGIAWEVTASHSLSQTQVQKAVSNIPVAPIVQILGGKTIEVQGQVPTGSTAHKTAVENQVATALAKIAHVSASQVSESIVGPTWGGAISHKAEEALGAFLLAVTAYITLRFELKMALAALIAVVHDVAVTVGIYSLSGFQVTPSTVIAFLTILGYSLYDTIVVFDRIQENTRALATSGRMSYTQTVNLSINQVLMRSINTSLMAILPILSVLVVGAYILGAVSLKNFGLALFIGLTTGAYSSIFIASPLLAIFKERETRYKALRERLSVRGESETLLTPAAAAAALGTSKMPSVAPQSVPHDAILKPKRGYQSPPVQPLQFNSGDDEVIDAVMEPVEDDYK